MKRLILVLVLALPGTATAVNLTCVVPDSAVGPAQLADLCESKRQALRIRADVWSNNMCASVFLREGLRQGMAAKAQEDERRAAMNAHAGRLETFDTAYPLPAAARCGDGVLDNGTPPGNINLGEQCDDGNNTPLDGCNENCETELSLP